MSMSVRHAAVRVLPLVLLAGCGATFDYAGLKALEPSGDDFAAALARDYRNFALFEADRMYDWPDAAHFGDKALAAAAGTPPPPERPADWRLPAEARAPIAAARTRLAAALSQGARERTPEAAARAQARFDCWVEQQEENWQTDHIAGCRDGFHAAMAQVATALAAARPTAQGAPAAPAEVPAPVRPAAHAPEAMTAVVAAPTARSFTAFFAFDSATLDASAAEAVAAAARAAAAGAQVRILVNGHADRAGSAPYNMTLSRQRATAVARALTAHGVTPDRITIGAYGEARPRVATPDGVRDPRNRRVEVTVGPAPAL